MNDTIRMATYNIKLGFGRDSAVRIEEMVDELRALEPIDILALQEVGAATWEFGGMDLLEFFAARLGFRYGRYASLQVCFWTYIGQKSEFYIC